MALLHYVVFKESFYNTLLKKQYFRYKIEFGKYNKLIYPSYKSTCVLNLYKVNTI